MCSDRAGSQDLPVLEHYVSYTSVVGVEGSDEENCVIVSFWNGGVGHWV